MKRGSNMLLLMIGGYVLIAIVLLLIFLPGSSKSKTEELVSEDTEARVVGDAGSDVPVPEDWMSAAAQTQENETVTEPETVSENLSGEENVVAAEPTEVPEEKHYYRFRVNTTRSFLYVRESGDISSQKVGEMRPGTEGYVIERGESWSLIHSDDGSAHGYSSNAYMTFTEVPREEFPEEYR